MPTPRLTIDLPEPAGEEPLLEFRIFPAGVFSTLDGDFHFDAQAAREVMESYRHHGVELHIDFEHASEEPSGEIPEGAPAAGWFVPEVRDGALWATRCRWSDLGYAALRRARSPDGQLLAPRYRYFSPTFYYDRDHRVTCLKSVALTNTPKMDRLEPLMAASRSEENPMDNEELDRAFDRHLSAHKERLDKACDRLEQACDRLDKLRPPTDEAPPADDESELARLRAFLKDVTGQEHAEAQEGALLAMKAGSELAVGQAETVASLRANGLAGEIEKIVDDGIKAGRLLPAERAARLADGQEWGVAKLRAYVTTRPPVAGFSNAASPGAAPGEPGLDPAVERLARAANIDPKLVAKHLRAI